MNKVTSLMIGDDRMLTFVSSSVPNESAGTIIQSDVVITDVKELMNKKPISIHNFKLNVSNDSFTYCIEDDREVMKKLTERGLFIGSSNRDCTGNERNQGTSRIGVALDSGIRKDEVDRGAIRGGGGGIGRGRSRGRGVGRGRRKGKGRGTAKGVRTGTREVTVKELKNLKKIPSLMSKKTKRSTNEKERLLNRFTLLTKRLKYLREFMSENASVRYTIVQTHCKQAAICTCRMRMKSRSDRYVVGVLWQTDMKKAVCINLSIEIPDNWDGEVGMDDVLATCTCDESIVEVENCSHIASFSGASDLHHEIIAILNSRNMCFGQFLEEGSCDSATVELDRFLQLKVACDENEHPAATSSSRMRREFDGLKKDWGFWVTIDSKEMDFIPVTRAKGRPVRCNQCRGTSASRSNCEHERNCIIVIKQECGVVTESEELNGDRNSQGSIPENRKERKDMYLSNVSKRPPLPCQSAEEHAKRLTNMLDCRDRGRHVLCEEDPPGLKCKKCSVEKESVGLGRIRTNVMLHTLLDGVIRSVSLACFKTSRSCVSIEGSDQGKAYAIARQRVYATPNASMTRLQTFIDEQEVGRDLVLNNVSSQDAENGPSQQSNARTSTDDIQEQGRPDGDHVGGNVGGDIQEQGVVKPVQS